LSQLMVVAEYDHERHQLRSGELLDFRLESNRNAYWERTATPPDWDRSHKFFVPEGSPFKVGNKRLILLGDFFGLGGSYLSIWTAIGDSLRYECTCPELFSGGFSLGEILAASDLPDAMYVLSKTTASDGGNFWGSLRVHRVKNCSASNHFNQSWSADNVCLTNTPALDYQYLPAASTGSLFVVLAKYRFCRNDKWVPDKELKIRIPLGESTGRNAR